MRRGGVGRRGWKRMNSDAQVRPPVQQFLKQAAGATSGWWGGMESPPKRLHVWRRCAAVRCMPTPRFGIPMRACNPSALYTL